MEARRSLKGLGCLADVTLGSNLTSVASQTLPVMALVTHNITGEDHSSLITLKVGGLAGASLCSRITPGTQETLWVAREPRSATC